MRTKGLYRVSYMGMIPSTLWESFYIGGKSKIFSLSQILLCTVSIIRPQTGYIFLPSYLAVLGVCKQSPRTSTKSAHQQALSIEAQKILTQRD